MSYSVFLVEKKGNVAVVTFNRPDKLNAANPTIFDELTQIMLELDKDPDVGCIILTGQTFQTPKGPRSIFSAGADIEMFSTVGEVEHGSDFIKTCLRPFRTIEEIETPVIAAVNGLAFGFGFEITMSCDICIAAKTARFALKEINHGAIPAVTLTRGLEKFSKQQVAYLCLTAKELTAEEAMAIGACVEVVDDEKLMARAMELGELIASRSAVAKAYIKGTLNRKAAEDYGDSIRFMPVLFSSKAMQNAFAKFLGRK
jgi:enoyl-CoA hydratase/carnithine racemase